MERAIPVLQINDYDEATAYYVEFLGFSIDFEWRHEEGFPVYMGVSRGQLALHLTEHRGDLSGPGAAHLQVRSVNDLYGELKARRDSMAEAPVTQAWGSTELKIVDPFGNRLTFASPVQGQ